MMFELRITHSYYGLTEVCDTSDNWDEIYAQALFLVRVCQTGLLGHIGTISIARDNETFTVWTMRNDDR